MVKTNILIDLIFTICVGVLILLGNALVILAFLKGPRCIRTYTNYFVVNLAISDLMVGCFSVPFLICLKLEVIRENSPYYEYFISLDILFGTTSILCLTAISLERLFAVKYPTSHYNLNKKPVLFSNAATWLVGILLAAIKLTIGKLGSNDIRGPYTMIITCASFFAPLIVIMVSYVVITVTAHQVAMSANLTKELRVAKTISVIIGLFVICWMPFFLLNMLYFFCSKSLCKSLDRVPWLINVTKALHISNSMMNFFVYAVRSPDFKATFKALVFNKCSTTFLQKKVRSFSLKINRTGSVVRAHYDGSKLNKSSNYSVSKRLFGNDGRNGSNASESIDVTFEGNTQ